MTIKDKKTRLTLAEAVDLAKKYLASTPKERQTIAAKLRCYEGTPDLVLNELERDCTNRYRGKTPNLVAQHFKAPRLRDQYRNDILYFWVPEKYTVTKPFGLLIFMHGGGASPATSRQYARNVLLPPSQSNLSYGLFPFIEHASFITVSPSAPWNEKSCHRWNLPEADDYICAVIEECRYRFNIDPDKVFLGGQSMGGFGAYHLCQRLCDRIAGGILAAGSWNMANWRSVIGTPLYIIHGKKDAVAPGTRDKEARPRFTDVFYGQSAHKLLTEAGVEHTYAEHSGGHSLRDAREPLSGMIQWMSNCRRDAYAKQVVVVSPRGSWHEKTVTSTPHNRWVSILAINNGMIEYSTVERTGPKPKWGESLDAFNAQGFRLGKKQIRGGIIEAENRGNNVFDVKTENVSRLSLWLHPKMADLSKPISVRLNGSMRVCMAEASLLTALRSYERRKDWGLIYYCELVLSL